MADCPAPHRCWLCLARCTQHCAARTPLPIENSILLSCRSRRMSCAYRVHAGNEQGVSISTVPLITNNLPLNAAMGVLFFVAFPLGLLLFCLFHIRTLQQTGEVIVPPKVAFLVKGLLAFPKLSVVHQYPSSHVCFLLFHQSANPNEGVLSRVY